MKKYIDITGTINTGMWKYDDPFTDIQIKPFPAIGWLKDATYGLEFFEGFHSQSGTFIETPAHAYGNRNSYAVIDIPPEKMIDVPCVVLNLGMWDMDPALGRRPMTVKDLESCFNAKDIREGDAIILGTGYGRYWFHPKNLDYAPYMTKEAMDWLLDKKPVAIGSDSTRWDVLDNPQGFWDEFYAADVLLIGPFVDLERCSAPRCKLTILPPKFPISSCVPARAFIIEED